jgi:chromosome segregation and condensation protein ScpB
MPDAPPAPATWKGLTLNPATRQLSYDRPADTPAGPDTTSAGQDATPGLVLTQPQAGLLTALLNAQGQPVTIDDLASTAGLTGSDVPRVVSHLRSALREAGFVGQVMSWGRSGYRIVSPGTLASWQDISLDLAPGSEDLQLSYKGSHGRALTQALAGMLEALLLTSGEPVMPGKLISASGTAPGGIRDVVGKLRRELVQAGFDGQVMAWSGGYRIIPRGTLTSWRDISLNLAPGSEKLQLSYKGAPGRDLTQAQAAMVEALLLADGQPVLAGKLASVSGTAPGRISDVMSQVRRELDRAGFDGQVMTWGGGYRVVPPGRLASWQDLSLELDPGSSKLRLSYQGTPGPVLTQPEAGLLEPLLVARGQSVLAGKLISASGVPPHTLARAVDRLQAILRKLEGFAGRIGSSGEAYWLAMDAAGAAQPGSALDAPATGPGPASWQGLSLGPDPGSGQRQLSYQDTPGPVLTPTLAGAFEALLLAGGQPLPTENLAAAAGTTPDSLPEVLESVQETLGELAPAGFTGQLMAWGTGRFRLVLPGTLASWGDLSLDLDPGSGKLQLSYQDTPGPALTPTLAGALEALLLAGGQPLPAEDLIAAAGTTATGLPDVRKRLRAALAELSLPGQVMAWGRGRFRLVLPGTLASWGDLSLDLGPGSGKLQLSYQGVPGPALDPAPAGALEALLLAGGQPLPAEDLIAAAGTTPDGLYDALKRLREALAKLQSFPGQVMAWGSGRYRLVLPGTLASWEGVSLGLDSGKLQLSYREAAGPVLTLGQAGVLEALLLAGGRPLSVENLAAAAGSTPGNVGEIVAQLRKALAELPFTGRLITWGDGYRLVLPGVLASWQGLSLHLDLGSGKLQLTYQGAPGRVLPPAPAGVLEALLLAGGRPLSIEDLAVAAGTAPGNVGEIVAQLRKALAELPFTGRLITWGDGYRLVLPGVLASWQGLSLHLDLGSGKLQLTYQGAPGPVLPPTPAGVLEALLLADGQPVTAEDLAAAAGTTRTGIPYAVSDLRVALGELLRLSGFAGQVQSGRNSYWMELAGAEPGDAARAAGEAAGGAGPAGGRGGRPVMYNAYGAATPAPSRALLESLEQNGQRLVQLPRNDFCLANALLTGAAGPLAAAGITTPQQLHEELAGYLERTPDWGDLEVEARAAWAETRARASAGPAYDQFYALAGTPGGQAQMREDLVRELAQAGAWPAAGFDLALAVAARRFSLAATIVYADGRRHAFSPGTSPVTLVRNREGTHWDVAVPVAARRSPSPDGDPGPASKRTRGLPSRPAAGQPPAGAGPAGPAEAGPAEAGPAVRAMAPVFEVREQVEVLDQARRWRTGEAIGAAEAPLGPGEEVRAIRWRLLERQLHYSPQIDRQFPLRDWQDPLNKVYAPFALPDGTLDPEWEVAVVSTEPPENLRVMLGADTGDDTDDPQAVPDPRVAGVEDWDEVTALLEQDVHDLVQATIDGPDTEPRLWSRILTADDVAEHEKAQLPGQYGSFLTPAMLAAAEDLRPLLRNGRVLAMYPGAVLASNAAREGWAQAHPEQFHTMDTQPGQEMASEGYAGAAAFTNTRVLPGSEEYDTSFLTGINAVWLPFWVNLTHPRRQPRTIVIMALVGLDNLYGPHNPAGMVLVSYGAKFPLRFIKSEPSTP